MFYGCIRFKVDAFVILLLLSQISLWLSSFRLLKLESLWLEQDIKPSLAVTKSQIYLVCLLKMYFLNSFYL